MVGQNYCYVLHPIKGLHHGTMCSKLIYDGIKLSHLSYHIGFLITKKTHIYVDAWVIYMRIEKQGTRVHVSLTII